jgi:hypothetical protein
MGKTPTAVKEQQAVSRKSFMNILVHGDLETLVAAD